jgi:hypothetical protein
MKNKLTIILFLLLGTVYSIFGQNITDALNYSSDSYQGTARFTSMSGAFGALGGDLSAIAVNPAGSAIFNNGHFSISFGSDSKANSASVLNSKNEFTKNNITLNQIGGVITFENLDKQTNWGKISLTITYNQTKNNSLKITLL